MTSYNLKMNIPKEGIGIRKNMINYANWSLLMVDNMTKLQKEWRIDQLYK